jgi:EmrB/QacA subfamily drug resistance transporter
MVPHAQSSGNGLSARGIALVVAVALFLQMLDGAIIATSLPQMARDFGVEPLELSVGVTTYLLVSAIFIPVAGWMADRFGSTRIFALAVVVFSLSSVGCGLAQNLVAFVAARAFQGIGGAFMIPVGRLIAVRNADKSEMLDVMSLITWPALTAPVVGPALGGAITTYFSWRWNFFINVPLGLGIVAVTLALVRDPTPLQRRKLDWLGFLFCGGSLACLLIGLEGVTHASDGLWLMLAIFVVGVALGVASVVHLRRSSNPLIDLVPFKAHTFAVSNLLAGNYARIAINAMPFLLPLFFQTVYGLDPLQAGGLTMAYFIGNFSMKSVTSPILRRFGFRPVLVFNGVLAAIFIGLCATLAPTTPYLFVIPVLVGAGLTRSMQFTSLSSLAFADIAPEHRNSAVMITSMTGQISMIFGVALAALILNLSMVARGGEALGVVDFQFAFLTMGAMALLSALLLLRLSRDAGDEIVARAKRA